MSKMLKQIKSCFLGKSKSSREEVSQVIIEETRKFVGEVEQSVRIATKGMKPLVRRDTIDIKRMLKELEDEHGDDEYFQKAIRRARYSLECSLHFDHHLHKASDIAKNCRQIVHGGAMTMATVWLVNREAKLAMEHIEELEAASGEVGFGSICMPRLIREDMSSFVEAAMQTLRQGEHGEEDGDQMCAICLEDFQLGEKFSTMPCSHLFHYGCLKNWLVQVQGRSSCPVCRQSLKGSRC